MILVRRSIGTATKTLVTNLRKVGWKSYKLGGDILESISSEGR